MIDAIYSYHINQLNIYFCNKKIYIIDFQFAVIMIILVQIELHNDHNIN